VGTPPAGSAELPQVGQVFTGSPSNVWVLPVRQGSSLFTLQSAMQLASETQYSTSLMWISQEK
jgi:hypothetical protein